MPKASKYSPRMLDAADAIEAYIKEHGFIQGKQFLIDTTMTRYDYESGMKVVRNRNRVKSHSHRLTATSSTLFFFIKAQSPDRLDKYIERTTGEKAPVRLKPKADVLDRWFTTPMGTQLLTDKEREELKDAYSY